MINVYLHSKNDNNKFLLKYMFLLLPFFLYGFYKNGIKLYTLNLVSFIELFKPLYLLIIALFISIITSVVFKKEIISYKLIGNIIISLIVMPNINIIIYTILLLLLNIIYHFYKFNICSLFMIIASLCLMFFNNYSYNNAYEVNKVFHYSFFDVLIGKQIGGVGNTLLILTLISLIVLMLSWCYKKTIVVSSLLTFYFLYFIYCFISGTAQIAIYASPSLLFSFVFISPLSIYSPYTRSGGLIYGIILGLLSFLFVFWNFELGVYISIFVANLFSTLLDRIFTKKNNKQLIETL